MLTGGPIRVYSVVVRGGGPQGTLFDTDAWAREALGRLARLRDVERVGLALSEGGGRRHLFTAGDRADRADQDGLDWCQVDAYDDVPLNTVARTGEPVMGSLADLEDRYPAFVEHQRGASYGAVAAVPIIASGQVLGGFVLYFVTAQAFPDPQQAELRELGEQLGRDLRRAQVGEGRARVSLVDEPVPTGARVAVYRVATDLSAVGEARRVMARTLTQWQVDDGVIDLAVLCLSELVTNALIHTDGGAEVRILLDAGVLTTTVRDGGRGSVVADEPDDDPLRARGRGLQIVAAVADRWGSRLDSVGTTVWFVLET